MKQINAERFYTYWADSQHSWTVRFIMTLCNVIDRSMLQDAVAATQQRYPYYSVRLRKTTDAEGREHYVLDENPQPWVVMPSRQPACLLSPESNHHLLAFACWDNCIAIDFFHALTDGTGGYNVLRTLLYEYCRRRYDSQLSREGVRVAGDDISPEELTDPGSLPRPDKQNPLPVPPMPRPINLSKDAVVPLSDTPETVCIEVDEQQMMKYVSGEDTSPATLVSLLVARAIARLHGDRSAMPLCSAKNKEAVPVTALAINQRPALGMPLASPSLASALRLSLVSEMQDKPLDLQQTIYRGMVVLQSNADNVAAGFWQAKGMMDQLDQIPTVKGRHQAMQGVYERALSTCSFVVSYVGKARFGEAERYVTHFCTEVWTPYALTIEMSAVGGKFCISWMHRFSTDVYLDALFDEMRQLGLEATVSWRRPLLVATLADYHE